MRRKGRAQNKLTYAILIFVLMENAKISTRDSSRSNDVYSIHICQLTLVLNAVNIKISVLFRDVFHRLASLSAV